MSRFLNHVIGLLHLIMRFNHITKATSCWCFFQLKLNHWNWSTVEWHKLLFMLFINQVHGQKTKSSIQFQLDLYNFILSLYCDTETKAEKKSNLLHFSSFFSVIVNSTRLSHSSVNLKREKNWRKAKLTQKLDILLSRVLYCNKMLAYRFARILLSVDCTKSWNSSAHEVENGFSNGRRARYKRNISSYLKINMKISFSYANIT